MPGPVPGIHVFRATSRRGRDKPGQRTQDLAQVEIALEVRRAEDQHGDAGMMVLAKIVYGLMSILAALLLASSALLLVDIYAYGHEMPDWWVHVLSLVLLAIGVWFV